MNDARKTAGAGVTGVRPASDMVAATLATHPGRTAPELAQLAGLGGSTVAKALAALEKAGHARRRTPGPDDDQTDGGGAGKGGRGQWRPAARWQPIAAEPTPPAIARGNARPTEGVPSRTAPKAATKGRRNRLGKGELTALVLEYLLAYPDADLGPTAISRALQRSQGAVANCLTKLTVTGDLVQTCEHPRRYRLAS